MDNDSLPTNILRQAHLLEVGMTQIPTHHVSKQEH